MYCPRCGALMDGGICNECGFPVTVIHIGMQSSGDGKRNRRRLIEINRGAK